MEADLQKRVQRYGWDKASAFYDRAWQRQLQPAHDLLFQLAGIKENERILDVACGTGLTSFRARELTGNNGYVLGTDISEKMIGMATETAMALGLSNIKFERMDAEALQLPSGLFDVALCGLGLMYTPSPVIALKEMYRALRTGGRCAVAVWGSRSACGWAEIFEIVDRRVASEVCPLFFQLGNELVLQKNFESAGFSDIQIKRISTRLKYSSADEACSAAFEGGPVALAYFKFPAGTKEEVRKEYLSSIDSYKDGEGYDVPGEFVVAIGTR